MKNLGILVFVIGILLLAASAVFNQMNNEQTNEANSRAAEGTNHKWSVPAIIGVITIFSGVGIYLFDVRRKQQLDRKKP